MKTSLNARLASFASARRTVDPGGLECEKVDYARWLLHFRLHATTTSNIIASVYRVMICCCTKIKLTFPYFIPITQRDFLIISNNIIGLERYVLFQIIIILFTFYHGFFFHFRLLSVYYY